MNSCIKSCFAIVLHIVHIVLLCINLLRGTQRMLVPASFLMLRRHTVALSSLLWDQWFWLGSVSSIYIWSKNFSHSSMQKSEAKYGGNWRSYSTSVSGPCAKISLNSISIFPRRGLELTYYTHTIRLFTLSISAIFGFTFSNQVLTPDIYGAHWLGYAWL